MRKKGLLLLAALLALCGCTAQNNIADVSHRTMLTVVLWDYDKTSYDWKLIRAFEDSHPDVQVEVVSYPDAYYDQKMQARLLSGRQTDVFLCRTMKTLEPKRAENKAEKAAVNGSAEAATVSAPSVQIDLSKVKIEPLFADDVDFETFSKSDFRVVKIEACEAVPKSKKLLKFTLNDGTDRKRTILSGIHEYYEPEELVGKTCVAITNLPPRKMMGIDSEGMLISAVYEYDGREGLNLLMLDDSIPAGAKLY